jgi:predicted dehydrogenase
VSERLRVGVVGCGEAAQILHLPSLDYLHDAFEVVAVCDVSRHVAEAVGDRWRVARRFTDHRALLDDGGLDAVLVTSPDAFHAEVTIDALAAGAHVLVEKPMCVTLREADEVIAAQRASGRFVQVGQMRRYSRGFLAARDAVAELEEIWHARVHHMLGLNSLIIEPTSRVVRSDDLEAAVVDAGRRRLHELIGEAIGDGPAWLGQAYRLLIGLATHDISAMRELLGDPRRVLYAVARNDAWTLAAAFDYGPFVCQFESGFDRIPRTDANIEVYGERRMVRVDFVGPYVRNVPVRASVVDEHGGGVVERVAQPAWGDQFVDEWRAFAESIGEGREPKTSPADFRGELELYAAMVEHMR